MRLGCTGPPSSGGTLAPDYQLVRLAGSAHLEPAARGLERDAGNPPTRPIAGTSWFDEQAG